MEKEVEDYNQKSFRLGPAGDEEKIRRKQSENG